MTPVVGSPFGPTIQAPKTFPPHLVSVDEPPRFLRKFVSVYCKNAPPVGYWGACFSRPPAANNKAVEKQVRRPEVFQGNW